MAELENLHAGHRQRMKKRFLELGERGFDDHQLLEMVLFYSVPRKDTNPLAHALIQRFGSLRGVFQASPAELRQMEGVSENTVLLLQMLPQVMRRCQKEASEQVRMVSSLEDVVEYLKPYFFGLRKEQVYLLSADRKGRVLGCDLLGEGGDTSVGLDTRLLMETALRHRAAWVVLAHSHPSGLAVPSGADVLTTRNCNKILKALDIELWDHLIFADDDYVSLRQSRLLD